MKDSTRIAVVVFCGRRLYCMHMRSAPLLLLLAASPAFADDWPQWRGPQRNGISAETGWLEAWPEGGPPVAWRAEVGTGFSSFAVAGGRVLTLGNVDHVDTLFCLDAAKGTLLWKHSYPSDLGDRFFEGGPTSTPTVEGDRVYVLGRWGDAFCLEAATGKVRWSANVHKEAGVRTPGWGYAGSPLVHGDLVIFNVGEAGLALEKATGKVRWKSADKDSGYSTPLPVKRGDAWIALLGSGASYLAVDLATGREAWRVKWVTQYGCNAADPVVDGDRAFISTGYGRGGALLKMKDGDPDVAWQNKALGTQMNSAVLVGGHLYGLDGDTGRGADLKCVEFATGGEKWSVAGLGAGSLMAADGKLIVLSEKGELLLGPASPERFRPSARAQVIQGKCWTVPVLANGRILVRSAEGEVVCLDVRKTK